MPDSPISTGGADVIDSGTIIAHADDSITIGPIQDIETTFVFNFVYDDGKASIEVEFFEEEDRIEFIIFNHDGEVNMGPNEPITIGEVNNRRLSMNYNVNAREADKITATIFTYSLYLEGSNDVN